MAAPSTSALYVASVLVLIAFLALTSQVAFAYLPPHPLTRSDSSILNGLVFCTLLSYWRACSTPAGKIPSSWAPPDASSQRWCRKCNAWKPPRAHHCKVCAQCIARMDHHCPWTANCVSHRTLPHFARFLFYAVCAMARLEYFLWARLAHLWEFRNWPAYLGPSSAQLAHLFLLALVNSLTLFALVLLLGRTVWSMGENVTTIEGWEIERHHSLLRRARAHGGFVTGANGVQVRVVRHEFPYDVGIWANFCQGMGSRNPLAWFWPLSRTPRVESGLQFETNDFNDEGLSWPPPDPDRVPMPKRVVPPVEAQLEDFGTEAGMRAFRARQEQDRARWGGVRRRRKGAEEDYDTPSSGDDEQPEAALDQDKPDLLARQRWRNAEGERLIDFGVEDEEDMVVQDDDENKPLAQIIAEKKGATSFSRQP